MAIPGLAICLALLSAAPASAAVRLASPTGAGANPCNPTPCSLTTAVTGANPGDRVEMATGTYKLATTLLVNKAIDVGGALGASTVVEFTGNSGIEVASAGALLHDVKLVNTEQAMAFTLTLTAGTVERIYADGSKAAAGCEMDRGLLRDSVCRGGLNVFPIGAGSYQAIVTNVTADPLMLGAQGGANLAASVTNTAALPQTEGGGSESGLLVNVGMGASAAVALANSSYNSVDDTLSAGTEFQYTPTGTNGNQTVPPQFVNAAAGDFRQLPSSPTIDAGTTAVDPLGDFDLLGAARSQPRCIGGTPAPDIGAYELTPTEPCPVALALSPTTTTPAAPVIGFGKLKRNLKKGTAKLEVKVPASGQLKLSGKGIVAREVACRGRETKKLSIKAKGKKAEKLRSSGSVKLQAKATFTAADGGLATKTKPVTLKLSE